MNKISKVLLVQVHYTHNRCVPLSIAYIAAVLEKNNFKVNIIDCTVEPLRQAFKKIICERPQIIGITASTPTFESAKFITKTIKEILPKTIIIIGGAHVAAMPYETMKSNCFNIGV